MQNNPVQRGGVAAIFMPYVPTMLKAAGGVVVVYCAETVRKLVQDVTKFNIVIVNRSYLRMIRTGSYNNSGQWPAKDVSEVSSEVASISDSSFSFAASYKLQHSSRVVTLAASWPMVGSRKIAIHAGTAESAMSPRELWERLDNSDDKESETCRAFIADKSFTYVIQSW